MLPTVFGLRSARGRAALATAVLIVVLVVVAIVTTFRIRQHQQQLLALEDTAASVAALEHARAQLLLELTSLSGLVLSDDPTFLDTYHEATLSVEQDLLQARAEAVAAGKTDYATTLNDLTERIGGFNEAVNAALPLLLEGDRATTDQLVSAAMPRMWAEVDAMVAGLDQLAQDQQAELAAERAAANDAAAITAWVIVGIGGIALLVATAVVIVSIASVVGPLVSLRASARAIASGDLKSRANVSGPEEVASLARDFNEMTDALATKTGEYIAITNLTGDIIVKVDREGRWVFVNDAACQFYGKSREELLGGAFPDCVHPEDVTLTLQTIRDAVARQEEVRGFVNRQVTPMGVRVVEWNGCPFFDEEGRYGGIQVTGRDIAERRQMEEALRQSEENYRRVVQDSIDGIGIIEGLDVRFVNRAVVETFGYESEEEMLGRPFSDFLPSEWQQVLMDRARARQAGEQLPSQYEFKAVRKDGTTFDAEASVGTIAYQGRPAVQAIIRDITERKQAEEALRESEARYRLLAENTSDLIWTVDLGLRYTYMSPAITRMRGYSVEEIVGSTVAETMTPVSLEAARKTLAEELAMERMEEKDLQRSRKLELEMYCRDGSTIWTEMNMTFLRDSDGNAIGILGVTRDISERKQMEEALADKTEEYVAVTNLTRDIIGKVDRKGRWVFLNDAACEFLGKPRQELLDTDSAACIHPEDVEASVQAVRKAAATAEPIERFVNRQVTPTGTRVVEWSASPIFDDEGRYAGIQMTGRDVTERKKAEKVLRESEERLRSLVTNVAVVLFAIDREGTFTLSEGKGLDGLGLRPNELVGRSVFEVYRDTPQIGENIRRALAGEALTATVEVAGLAFETHYTPVRDHDGEVFSVIGVAIDVTERKQMEEALSESEEQYRAIFEQAADSVLLVDAETGALVQFNDRAHQALGYTREEFEKLTIPDFEIIESPEEVAKHLKKIAREGSDTFETKQRTKSGEIRDIEVRGRGISIRGRDFIQTIWCDITDRKKAQEALQESEERLKILFESAPDAYYLNDLEGNFVDGNNAAQDLVGYEREELIGKGFFEVGVLPPEQLPKAAAILAKNVQGLPTGPDEVALVRKDGCKVPVEIRTFPVRIRDQTLVLGIARDITERKRAEAAIAAKTKEYVDTVNLTDDIIMRLDKDGRFSFVNDSACRIFARSREELLGADAQAFLHPEDLQAATQAVEGVIDSKGLVKGFETRLVAPTGIRLVEWNGHLLFDEEGQYAGIQITGHDITERKQAEEAVRESEERYRLLAENTSDLIWTMDLSLRYTYMSPAIMRMRGYTAEEIMDAPITETMTPASVEVARETLARELAVERGGQADPNRATKVELEMYCKDGSTIWTEMNMTWLHDSDGKPVGILGVTRDISERKRAEQERERLNAELQMRAITDSLTALYDHAHFYQRLAEEIDRSKRYKHGFAVVMMDVDDFKRFNDSRGHQAGDEMLRLVADCIRAGVRRSDIPFRYGGDEFAAILPHADAAKARAAVSRINERITKRVKRVDGEAAARLSLSAGVACFPDDGTTTDDLVRVADAALYSAKWVARARDIMGQREDIQSLISALVGRRAGVEGATSGVIFRPEALHEQQARIVSSVASSITVALKDAGVADALEDPDLQVLATVGAAAEIKDRYIRGHPERTSEHAVGLAQEMGLSAERVRHIRIAGLLHDIGKVTVSEGILNKPGKLTRREFDSIKDHPIVGATLVSQVRGFERLVPIVRHHHERFDGSGYPDGLAGGEIPLEARILSVVDVFDALTHQRSYRKALTRDETIAELERGAGTQFDPGILTTFLALVKRGGDGMGSPAQAASEDRQRAAARVSTRRKG